MFKSFPEPETKTPETAVLNGECRYCGRDYGTDEDDGCEDGPCPETDECPSYFEAVGIEHPDYPSALAVQS